MQCGRTPGRWMRNQIWRTGGCWHSNSVATGPDAAHRGDVRRLQEDPGQDGGNGDEDSRGRLRDPGRRLFHARVRGGAGQDRGCHFEATRNPDDQMGTGVGTDGQILHARPARRVHRFQAEVHQALFQPDRSRHQGYLAIHRRGQGGTFPDDDHSYGVDEKEYDKFVSMVEKRKRR